MTAFRIHQLDPILANQIAAGEVVERPASVVKELVENSIDAGASRIQLDIEKGGSRLIRVTDNGKGIFKDDMALALSRHATSKIETDDDLAAIQSLGFRGEALASISSVAHLSLTSRWHEEQRAYRAEAAGREMEVSISPASLNAGTVVEVRDLFFNTPARRRFLRTEKTEFQHIENMLSRLALSHPEIGFQLKHNGKLIKNLLPAENRASAEKRIAKIAGREFLAKAVYFSVSHPLPQNNITISGWLGLGNYHRSQNDGQFVFVNGRIIRDRVINHAIREAYQGVIPPGRLAGFVIFIELDPTSIDVNVHPTKHEVRFHQGRMVHDFLTQAIRQVLAEGEELIPSTGEGTTENSSSKLSSEYGNGGRRQQPFSTPVTYTNSNFSNRGSLNRGNLRDAAASYQQLLTTAAPNDFTQAVTLVAEDYVLLEIEHKYWLVSLKNYLTDFVSYRWQQEISSQRLNSKPLMFPHIISIDDVEEFYRIHFDQGAGLKRKILSSNMNDLLCTLQQMGFNAVYINDHIKQLSAPVIDLFLNENAVDNKSILKKESTNGDLFSGVDQQTLFLTAISVIAKFLVEDKSVKNSSQLIQVLTRKLTEQAPFMAEFLKENVLEQSDVSSGWLKTITALIAAEGSAPSTASDKFSSWCQLLSQQKLQSLFQYE